MDYQLDLIAFYSLFETKNLDGYLGAVLITDINGIPREFRCSHPVKPTGIQKTLYGHHLLSFVGITVCGSPLFKAIKSPPSLIVVDNYELLPLRNWLGIPVVHVRRAGEGVDIELQGNKNNLVSSRIDLSLNQYQSIVVSVHYEYKEDGQVAAEVFQNPLLKLDPCEPFQRIANAINLLREKDSRFQ